MCYATCHIRQYQPRKLLSRLEKQVYVNEVYIRAGYRGQGIGRQAMAFAETQCRTLGVRALHLEVERDNITAYALYRKVGFVGHDRYLMTKRIS
jgi:diamine N-acetyltransferase